MDLQMAEEILSAIREASPDSKIIVLTMFDNLHYLKALSKMGIDAYVHKSSTLEEVIATIDALGRDTGGDNVVISMPRGFLEWMGEGTMGSLTERETEVLVLAACGLSNERKLLAKRSLSSVISPKSPPLKTSGRGSSATCLAAVRR